MNAWERERALARTTGVWAAGSIASGLALAVRRDPWWRAFGLQQLGWVAADFGIVGALTLTQRRRMAKLDNPYAPAVLERERRRLRTILWVNVAADAGYCVVGLLLSRRAERRAAGAGAAIVVQGAFLLAHDSYHALAAGGAPRARRRRAHSLERRG